MQSVISTKQQVKQHLKYDIFARGFNVLANTNDNKAVATLTNEPTSTLYACILRTASHPVRDVIFVTCSLLRHSTD